MSQLPPFGPLGLRQHFGAHGDGVTHDDASIRDWWEAGVAGRELHMEGGDYLCLQAVTFDLTGCREQGIKVTGAGQGRARLMLDRISDEIPFSVICSHGPEDDTAAEVSAFDCDLSGFSVSTRFDGPGARIGQDDFLDALNSCYFSKLKFDNNCDSDKTEALRVNHVLQTQFDVRANCVGRPCKNNIGTAVHLRQSKFNLFAGGFSNAQVGLLMSGGASSSNVMTGIDFEEGGIAVVIDSEHARNNKLVAPQIAYRHGFDFRAGENNIVDAPNLGLRTERFCEDECQIGTNSNYVVLNDRGLVFRNLLGEPTRPPDDLLARREQRIALLHKAKGTLLRPLAA